MSFYVKRRLSELNYQRNVIGNSTTVKVGDALIPGATTHAGAVIGAANTTGDIIGVAAAIFQIGHIAEVTSFATTSTNETIANGYWAEWEPINNIVEVEADLDAAAGTTTGSKLMGNFALSTSDSSLLLESSYTVWSTKSAKQFFSFGLLAGTTTKVRGFFIATITA